MTPPELLLVIEQGTQARDFMRSPVFEDTVNTLSNFFLAQVTACPSTDDALPTLRHAHQMHECLMEIVSHIAARAAAGEAAAEELNEPNEDDFDV